MEDLYINLQVGDHFMLSIYGEYASGTVWKKIVEDNDGYNAILKKHPLVRIHVFADEMCHKVCHMKCNGLKE